MVSNSGNTGMDLPNASANGINTPNAMHINSSVVPLVANQNASNLTPPLIPNEHILLTLMHQFQTLAHAIIDNFAYEGNSKCKMSIPTNFTSFSSYHNDSSLQRLHFANSSLKSYSSTSSLSSSLKSVFGEMTIGTYNDKFSSFLSENSQKEDVDHPEYDIRTIVFSSISLSDHTQIPQTSSYPSETQQFSDLQATFTSTIRAALHQDTQTLSSHSLTSLSGHEFSLNSGTTSNDTEFQFLYLIEAFRKVSKHCPNAVVEALLEWRSQFDCSPPQYIIKRVQKSLKKEKKKQQKEIAYIKLFTERKELAVNYIFLFVLLNILQLFIQPPLTNTLANRLIEFAFQHLLDAFSNHKSSTLNPLLESCEVVDDMYGQVLGILSITHFKVITDRFIQEIPGRFSTSVGRHEVVYLIRGMKYLKARLGDSHSIEFLQKFFDILSRAKKSDIKNACCDAGQSILSPLGVECNTDDQFYETCIKPQVLYCQKLNKKSKHIPHSYPYYSSLLCLCPRKTFLELFWSHVDALFKVYQKSDTKLKVLALDCLLHVFGYYMRLVYPPQSSSPPDNPVDQQKEKTEKSTCADRVKKLANIISSQHKRSAISIEQNEILYNAVVDLVVMMASSNIQLGIDFVLELLNADYIYSESIYIGLRALLNILDQSQMKSILSNPQLSSLLSGENKPLWLDSLLLRYQYYSGSPSGLMEGITNLRHPVGHISDSNRMQSPFNTYYSTIGTASSRNTFTSPTRYGEGFSIIDVDIMKFQEGLGKALSSILRFCESNTYLKGHEEVFVLALTLIPKLIPCDYTSDGVATLVSSCLTHSSKVVKHHSILVLQQLMELYPMIRAMLLDKVVSLVLEHISNGPLIQQLVLLVRKWVQLSHKKTLLPPTFGAFKYVKKQKLRISVLETVGVLLLCNDDPTIRTSCIDVFQAVSELASVSTSSSDREFILWDDQICIYDILRKSALYIIDSTFASKTHSTTVSPYKNVVSFLASDSFDMISKFLNKFSQCITEHIPCTSSVIMIELGFRIQELVSDPRFTSTDAISRQWVNYCEFVSGLVVRNTFSQHDFMKNRTRQFQTARDIYNLIVPNLKEAAYVSQTVEILGDTHPSMLDLLFEQIRPVEIEAFNQPKNVQRRIKKRKDFLKVQIARVYSRISENIDMFVLDSDEVVLSRFVDFMKEILDYLSNPLNMYNSDLHPLRFHFFAVIEQIIKKHYLVSSRIQLHISQEFYYKLLAFVIRWTGFGKADSRRSIEERRFLDAQKERCKDESAKKKLEAHYEQLTEVLKLKSTSSMSSLMYLFKLTSKELSVIEQWNRYNRRARKFESPSSVEVHCNINSTSKDIETSSQEPNQASSTLLKIGVASSVYKKLSILGSGGFNSTTDGTSTEKSLQSDTKEAFDQQLLEWLDEVLNSKPHIHRIGVDAVCNILQNNPLFISYCIDQCFTLNSRISEGYFRAICASFKHIDISLCVQKSKKLQPTLIVLILYMLISQNSPTRMNAFELLQLTSDFFFEENSKAGNFALMLSSTIQDANEMLQQKISRKLSSNHADLSSYIMKEIYSRIPYVPHYGQSMLLKALVPWVSCLSLEDRKINGRTPDDKKLKLQKSKQKCLEMLFEITKVYGTTFNTECEELWTALSERMGHIPAIIAFLLDRLMQIDAKATKNNILYSVAKQIILYLLASDEKETVSTLVQQVELRNIVEKSYISNHSEVGILAVHETVLILLVEVAYHSTAIGRHLAVLTQHCFMLLDHDLPIVSESCKHLLANLLHQFVIRRIPHNGGTSAQMERLQKAKQLVDQILRHKSKKDKFDRIKNVGENNLAGWNQLVDYTIERARHRPVSEFPSLLGDTSDTFKDMNVLLLGVLDTFDDQKEFENEWGRETILWATHNHLTLSMISRSFQIFRCILPQVNYSHLQLILQTLMGYLKSYISTNNIAILDVILEIIDSLRELILSMDKHKLVLFSQLFWLSVALLRSDVIELYIAGLCLLGDVLSSFDMGSASVQNVILSTQPNQFEGIQILLQKGILNMKSKPLVIQLLTKLALLNCDARILFQGSSYYSMEEAEKGRILQLILLLVPYMCSQLLIHKEATSACRDMAARLALACDRQKLKKIARVFVRYSNGDYTHEDKFLLELRKPISDLFFPNFENMVYETMETLLESPEFTMQEAVLSFLHSWILHVDLRYSILYKQSRLLSIVTSLINQKTLHDKAVKVLDVAVRISCKDSQGELTLMSKSHDAPVTLKSIPSFAQSSIHHRSYFNPAPGAASKSETLSVLSTIFEQGEMEHSSNDYLRLIIDHHTGHVLLSSSQSRNNSNENSDATDSTETDVEYHTMSRSFKYTHDESMQKKIGLFDDLLNYEMAKYKFCDE